MHIEIRNLQSEDLVQLAVLMTELGYPTSSDEMIERAKQLLNNESYTTFVAINEGTLLGAIGFLKIYFWEKNGCYVKVQVLITKQEHRKLGIGKLLLHQCELKSTELGAELITLNCGNRLEREAAHQFYPKMGFEATSTGYTKKLK